VAGRRADAAPLLLRHGSSVRGGPTSRRRSRSAGGRERARPCRRDSDVRRHGSDRREDGVDRDAVRLHSDARPPRLDRRQARRARLRRLRGRHGRPQRRRRPRRTVRLLRAARDEQGPGIRRSADLPPGAARRDPRRRAGARGSGRRARGASVRGAGGRGSRAVTRVRSGRNSCAAGGTGRQFCGRHAHPGCLDRDRS
jgi:hypothetical protein